MNIYFACSITGGRKEESIYQKIVDTIHTGGHQVPTAHLSRPEVMDLEDIVDPEEIYCRDIEWITNCDALIAEVSTPSHGVGYEISYALSKNKPVLCLHKQDVRISKMICGNNHPKIQVRVYKNPEEINQLIYNFLSTI
ncbi:MAG: nucleoside 2-deoxyribosyltransferase [Chloroflexota bacterium]|nr:MAG: nucleoside 2-deoxyribosyltransferase [Chloroflexota bacterium]